MNKKLEKQKIELPKREINEITNRLKLEPHIREIYVEGIFDRDFYRNALKALDINDVQVYPISTVNIPNEILIKLELSEGERQRVQALASELMKNREIHSQVLLLIDADLDYILENKMPSPPLICTDGTATELIMWNKKSLERFFELALGRQDSQNEVNEIMPDVESIACEIFIFRAAKDKVAKDWKIIEIQDSFSKNESFSLEIFCEKNASKNAGHKLLNSEIKPLIEKIKIKSKKLELKQKMHGHDLMAILSKKLQLKGFNHGCIKDPDELSRITMASIEWTSLISNETIQKLKNKFQKSKVRS